MKYIHYLAGGGLGDVFREAIYHNAVGILRRWKNEHPDAHLKVFLMSHNPASHDLLKGQDWIDQVVQRRFPIERTWKWEDAYTEYAAEFDGYTELRFTLPERRSLYASQFNRVRPKREELEYIDPVGMLWEPKLITEWERHDVRTFNQRIVLHPGAGQSQRALPESWVAHIQELTRPIFVGADYERAEHGGEEGTNYSPRVLYHGLQRARAVVGSESSVWYLATMLGVPAALLYQPEQTYDLVQQGKNTWNWYFGDRHPENGVFKLPEAEGFLDWLAMHR